MRHGDDGELGPLVVTSCDLDVDCRCSMDGWELRRRPGYGWPVAANWVNTSPHCAEFAMPVVTRVGHVGGLHLSEGRAHDPPAGSVRCSRSRHRALVAEMRSLAPSGWWVQNQLLFEPNVHKHVGKLCAGFQVHGGDAAYYDHAAFKPWRLFGVGLQALRRYGLTRDICVTFPTNTTGRLQLT